MGRSRALFMEESAIERHVNNNYRRIRALTGAARVGRVAAANFAREHGIVCAP